MSVCDQGDYVTTALFRFVHETTLPGTTILEKRKQTSTLAPAFAPRFWLELCFSTNLQTVEYFSHLNTFQSIFFCKMIGFEFYIFCYFRMSVIVLTHTGRTLPKTWAYSHDICSGTLITRWQYFIINFSNSAFEKCNRSKLLSFESLPSNGFHRTCKYIDQTSSSNHL